MSCKISYLVIVMAMVVMVIADYTTTLTITESVTMSSMAQSGSRRNKTATTAPTTTATLTTTTTATPATTTATATPTLTTTAATLATTTAATPATTTATATLTLTTTAASATTATPTLTTTAAPATTATPTLTTTATPTLTTTATPTLTTTATPTLTTTATPTLTTTATPTLTTTATPTLTTTATPTLTTTATPTLTTTATPTLTTTATPTLTTTAATPATTTAATIATTTATATPTLTTTATTAPATTATTTATATPTLTTTAPTTTATATPTLTTTATIAPATTATTTATPPLITTTTPTLTTTATTAPTTTATVTTPKQTTATDDSNSVTTSVSSTIKNSEVSTDSWSVTQTTSYDTETEMSTVGENSSISETLSISESMNRQTPTSDILSNDNTTSETVSKSSTVVESLSVTNTQTSQEDVILTVSNTLSISKIPNPDFQLTKTKTILDETNGPSAAPNTSSPVSTQVPETLTPDKISYQPSSVSIGVVTLFRYEVACDLLLQSLRNQITSPDISVTSVVLEYGCLADAGNPGVGCHSVRTKVDYSCPQSTDDFKGGLIEIEGKCFLDVCDTIITFIAQFEGGDSALDLYHVVQKFITDENSSFRAMFPRENTHPPATPHPTHVPVQETALPSESPVAVPTALPTPEPTVNKSNDYSSVTLWLGIAGIGGILALGSLLIIRLTNRGRASKNVVQIANDNCELHPVVTRTGRSPSDPRLQERSPSMAYDAWNYPPPPLQQQQQQQQQQQVSFVSEDPIGRLSPMPVSPPADKLHTNIIASGLPVEVKESRRYNSIQDSWESLDPIPHTDFTTVVDPYLVEEQAVMSLLEALELKGIDVKHLPQSEIISRALRLLHCRSQPLRFCGNCTKPTSPIFSIYCCCQNASYCCDECRLKHWPYHKVECVK